MIIYSLVARGSLVLCEYTEIEGDFPSLVRKILVRTKKTDDKQLFTKDNYIFCIISHQEIKFLCMIEQSDSKDRAFSFLEEVKQDFLVQQQDPNFSSGKYASRLGLLMKKPFEKDALTNLEDNIQSLNDQAGDNLTKLMERDTKLDVLVQMTKDLSETSNLLHHQSRKVRQAIARKHKGSPYQVISLAVILFLFLGLAFYLSKVG